MAKRLSKVCWLQPLLSGSRDPSIVLVAWLLRWSPGDFEHHKTGLVTISWPTSEMKVFMGNFNHLRTIYRSLELTPFAEKAPTQPTVATAKDVAKKGDTDPPGLSTSPTQSPSPKGSVTPNGRSRKQKQNFSTRPTADSSQL